MSLKLSVVFVLVALAFASAEELDEHEKVHQQLFDANNVLSFDETLRLLMVKATHHEKLPADLAQVWDGLLKGYIEASTVSRSKCQLPRLEMLSYMVQFPIKNWGAVSIQNYIRHWGNEQFKVCSLLVKDELKRIVVYLSDRERKALGLLKDSITRIRTDQSGTTRANPKVYRDTFDNFEANTGYIPRAILLYLQRRVKEASFFGPTPADMTFEQKFEKYVENICEKAFDKFLLIGNIYEGFVNEKSVVNDDYVWEFVASTRMCKYIHHNKDKIRQEAQELAANNPFP